MFTRDSDIFSVPYGVRRAWRFLTTVMLFIGLVSAFSMCVHAGQAPDQANLQQLAAPGRDHGYHGYSEGLAVGVATWESRQSRILEFALMAVAALLVFTLWRSHVSRRNLLGASEAEIRARLTRLGDGDFSLDEAVPAPHPDSLMGRLDEARRRLLAREQARQEAETQRRCSEARYRLLADHTSDVIWTMSLDGQITYVSPTVERLRGFAPEEAAQQSFEEILTPESQAITVAYFSRLADRIQSGFPPEPARNELEYCCKDGSTTWCDVHVMPVLASDGTPLELLGVSRDITALKRAESEARLGELRIRKMLENLPVGIAVASLQPERQILYSNAMFDHTFGYSFSDMPTEKEWAVRAYPDEDYRRASFERWNAAVAQAAAQDGRVTPHEFRVTCRDGAVKDVVISGTVLDDRLICAFVDITERKTIEADLLEARDAAETANRALQMANAELKQLAVMDRLTGIWNRAYFEDAMVAETARVARYGEPLSLVLVDIDHFKSINDTHGHLVGDQVLVRLTQRFCEHLRGVDVLARWGGEEFVILMPHCTASQAWHAAEKLRILVAGAPFPKVGLVTASFGVAELEPNETGASLLKRADDALYAAKVGGRNRVCHATHQAG